MWYDADEDYHKLKLAAESTGLEAYLKSRGKRWFALSPRWANDEKSGVRFWLNPQEQQKYSAGWFTVDELREWADERGPVIMKQKETA